HRERFIFNKIITGGFRVGVSSKLVTRALAIVTNIEENVIMHRLMGNWTPQSISFENLVLEKQGDEDLSRPYPFYLAYALDSEFDQLGSLDHWQAEYKWDGIRAQLIHRQGQVFLWSRGEELISQRFPEFEQASQYLPDGTVLDGELVLFAGDVPMSFQHLQTRIGRKNVTKKILETMPAAMICYDLLEDKGEDIRSLVLKDRRNRLEKIISHQPGNVLKLSPTIDFHTWSELDLLRQQARNRNAEGIMLKHRDSKYQSGRKRGDWWKWKIDPLTIDAVLLYAQQGHGRRANLFTDYTFAVWNGDDLVPFTKAYSGLTDAEFQEITRYVRANTLDRYGPVRAVVPNLVFEIAFEGIQASSRHKSGVALRFPRMLRWRKDKHPKEANTLEDLKAILKQYG
ncbi:MAG: ATP-dependent DNA ligase, partial [Saprospiraceae bacterium]|nr:ATP-dependent DNA ligase [Saprospiraceae bacterium]